MLQNLSEEIREMPSPCGGMQAAVQNRPERICDPGLSRNGAALAELARSYEFTERLSRFVERRITKNGRAQGRRVTAVDRLLTVLVLGVIVIAVTVVVGAGISLMIALAINRI
jgi:hypothetical protein